MTRKRLLAVPGSNVMVDTDLAALLHLVGDEWTTVIFDPATMDASEAADYDAVLLSHAIDAKVPTAAIVDATKPGRLFMHACDIQFTDRAPGGAARKPLTLIASLHPSITGTPEGDALTKAWLKPLHRDSRIVFCEFLAGLVHTIGPETEAAAERARDVEAPDIRSFYWGIKRPGVVESLKSLGFGSDPRDAVFGAARRSFPKVRDLTREPKYDIDTWAPFVVHAEQVPLPFEAVKSEHQITRRLLECAYLAGPRTVLDPRISDHVRRFLDPAEWRVYAKQVGGELLGILDEGLPGVSGVNEISTDLDLGPTLADDRPKMLGTLRHVLDLKPTGTAIEFGVGSGRSLRMIAEQMPAVGFDCWTGLPSDWRPGFPAGTFACDPPNVPGAMLVPGLVQDTLLQWMHVLEAIAHSKGGIGLVHLDLDLEDATAFVLAQVVPLLKPGAYLVFDEIHGWPGWQSGGEYKAWSEYLSAHEVVHEVVGHGPEQWAIRLSEG